MGCARFWSSLCRCSLSRSRLDAPCVGQFAGNCASTRVNVLRALPFATQEFAIQDTARVYDLFKPKPLQGNLAWAPVPSSPPRDTQMFALFPSPATIFTLAPRFEIPGCPQVPTLGLPFWGWPPKKIWPKDDKTNRREQVWPKKVWPKQVWPKQVSPGQVRPKQV